MKTFFKKYSFLIGVIIFALILSQLDFSKLVSVLEKIQYKYLVLASLIAPLILISKGYRWNYLKKIQGINYSIKDSILIYGAGIFIGVLTPGRLGDLIKVMYLKNNKCSIGKSFVSVISDRLADLIFLLLFSCLGISFFFSFLQKPLYLSVIGLISLIAFFFILLKTDLNKKIFHFFVPFKYKKSWKLNINDFVTDLKTYTFKNYLATFILTTISWTMYYFQMYFLAKSVGISIPFLYISIATTIAGFITLLPVSILGLGTRDAVLIMLFSNFAIPNESTISFSVLILLMAILVSVIGYISWIIKPIKIDN